MALDSFLVALSCLGVALFIYAALHLFTRQGAIERTRGEGDVKDSKNLEQEDEYPKVEPLVDFEWSKTEPLRLRPFKPMYHLTMGLTNIDVSSLVQMDWNYIERMKLRRQVMRDHEDTVVGAEPIVKEAVDEFYTWLLGTYLPTRYPSMFTLSQGLLPGHKNMGADSSNPSNDMKSNEYTHLISHPMQETYPLRPFDSPKETLKVMGGIIDDDCQFLLPSEDGDGYVLRGFVNCFPSGFKMSSKLNLKLRDIHGPVPHYKEKLDKSMDRFFDKLEVGRIVRRVNWTVSTTPDLYNPSGNHLREGDAIPDDSDVDISKAIFRCELQSLHKLPRTKANLFMFKTYSYPLQQLKDEGLGPDLAVAIDGMRDGTAPGIHRYKKAVVWGEQVKEFLRS